MGGFTPYGNNAAFSSASTVSVTLNAHESSDEIPLTTKKPVFNPHLNDPEAGAFEYQQWDESGHAVGFTGDPQLHAPRPRVPFGTTDRISGTLGTQYPTSPRADGRIPVRQGSRDSVEADVVPPVPLSLRAQHTAPSEPSGYTPYTPQPQSEPPMAGEAASYHPAASPAPGPMAAGIHPSTKYSPPPSYRTMHP
jgi:hypothetical protein